jgi:2-(1,2-epoxy-1,2-dihydrophenyl)acetyl-CoA isomerase
VSLRFELDEGIASLVLDRPQARNALDEGMRDALAAAVTRIEGDRSIRAVLLTGAGDHFCAGGDVKHLAGGGITRPEDRLARMRSYHSLIRSLAALDRPVIAAVDGVAYGAGFGLALLADLVIASDRARFCLAFHRVGLVPDFGATYTLPRAVGMQRARELIYTAREFGAVEAKALGLVLEVISPKALAARGRQVARAMASASQVGFGMSKRALGASLQSDLSTVLEMESTAQAIAATSDDARDALQAVAERRQPPFQWPPGAQDDDASDPDV